MAKEKTVYRCQSCGVSAGKWLGRCSSCAEWGTLVEEAGNRHGSVTSVTRDFELPADAEVPVPLVEVEAGVARHRPTTITELDRVLGGGFVPGSSVLLGGEPGIGKSTLLLQAATRVAARGGTCLLVTAEESKEQVRLRADRLGDAQPRCFVVGEQSVVAVATHMRQLKPALVVVDSVQAVRHPGIESAAGSVAQVRESAGVLVSEAKSLGSALVLVGHVTKDGTLAGPRVLEHLVDVVLAFEGDRHHGLRTVRAVKNRFGAAGELGVFEMTSDGLIEMPDASRLLLTDGPGRVSGSAVACMLEGRRPLLVEVQALLLPARSGGPRRSVTGLDPNRVNVLCGVLEKRLQLDCGSGDLFASAAGGVRVSDPAADLAICAAIRSSLSDRAVPADTAYIGEVGLGGEVRSVSCLDVRVREAARFGFERIVVPDTSVAPIRGHSEVGADIVGVTDLAGAVALMAA